MINVEKKVLSNGLKVLIHKDLSTPLVAINILYNVGSRNEDPNKTGFAHLFEHLMFSGSKHASDFDGPIQLAGGESNAFTNTDITNFYEILPAENIETALWLESDRMQFLSCTEDNFKVQQSVVIEEFKETTLNQPYGEVWHHLSSSAYKTHPYRWPTIGLNPRHIAEAKIEDVQNFYHRFYNPNNAILCISGNIEYQRGFDLAEKWFGSIPRGPEVKRDWPDEAPQFSLYQEKKKANVPLKSIYFGFHMADRLDRSYYIADVISDILSAGRSSRFFQRLIKSSDKFSYIDAYITGTMDPGLFLIEAKPMADGDEDEMIALIWKELNELKDHSVTVSELQKIKNKIENALVFSEANILNKAINLCYYESLGNVNLINEQSQIYQSIQSEEIRSTSELIFKETNCTLITYLPEN